MKEDKEFIKNLNQIFKSKKFMRSLLEDKENFSEDVFRKLGRVLEYYIVSRDENINYTYKEIEEKLSQINYEESRENIIDNGFVTHSFNGNKKDKINSYGFDYMSKMSGKELEQRKEMRESLKELEKILGTSRFVENLESNSDNKYSQNVFLSTPGAKTFYYACKRSPERLYEGPLKGYEKEPIIVGETKENYLMRVLEKKINNKYPQKDSKNRMHAIEVAKKVINSYGSSSPAFAMLKLSEIKDIQSGSSSYTQTETKSIMERINGEIKGDYKKLFSTNPNDSLEQNNLGDLIILSPEIPMSAISIVECMDEFEMQQIFAQMKGLRVGEYIDYTSDKSKGKPKIAELSTVIKSAENLEELNDTYISYKNEITEKLLQKKEDIKAQYGDVSNEDIKEKLKSRKTELLNRKTKILERKYHKKGESTSEYSLQDVLEELEKKNLKEHLLETDQSIKEDSLQYQSDIHGKTHTRRVNFLANVIMNLENVDDQTRKIVETFVKNHDIGRTNDIEDKEHGAKSVDLLNANIDRISELSEDQKEIVKFTIKEHSLSTAQNKTDLDNMFDIKVQKEFENVTSKRPAWMVKEDMKKSIAKKFETKKMNFQKVLEICKDADKLDRVRLDPLGYNPREGLDASRLLLNSSKKIEGLAYESFDKVLEILDIEQELTGINKKIDEVDEIIELESETSKFDEFEDKMKEEKLERKERKKAIVGNVVSGRRLSKVLEIPKKIKSLFLNKVEKKETIER